MHALTHNIAVIIPVYNEGHQLITSIDTIRAEMEALNTDYCIYLIDDGSQDNTWDIIENIAISTQHCTGISFSRNFGKEYAILAGLQEVDANYYLVMDSDLQHPPSMIKTFWAAINEEGIDAVEGIKKHRGHESFLYKICSNLFYKTLYLVSRINLKNSSDFKLLTRKFRDSVIDCEDQSFFFRGACSWVGYKRKEIPFNVEERASGKSKFQLRMLLNMMNDAILSNTKALLKISTFIGLLMGAFSIFLAFQTLYNKITGQALNGFTTVILVVVIQSTFLFLSLGILGEYLARIYKEVKRKPSYILRAKTEYSNDS